MKKFHFSLNTVKEYKGKLLDNLKLEYGAIVAAIAEQEAVIADLENKKDSVNQELNEKNAKGITPHEMMNYQRYLKVLQTKIKKENETLEKLRKTEAEKKEALIEMKKETTTLEKLKEKKLLEYNLSAQKDQEQFIEEFVSNQKYAKR